MEDVLITLTLVLYFLFGHNAGKHKHVKVMRTAINYELKLATNDYQKGWFDYLYFILNSNRKDR